MASTLDHPLITERYFFPRGYAVPNPTWVQVDGAKLACYSESNGNPYVVVFFHGNGEVVADYVPNFVDYFSEVGADSFMAEYRGYGESTGTPQLGKMLDDVEAIFHALDRPAEEMIVFGRSVGSIYAIEFVNRFPDAAGLILESGIANPLERIMMRVSPGELGMSRADLEAIFDGRLDNMAKLARRTRPTLVMHARYDDLVDVSHGVRLASAPASNCRLVLFDEGDHNSVFAMNKKRYMEEVAELIATCFRGDSYAPEEARPTDTRDTVEVSNDGLERTHEYDAPVPTFDRREGPGQTAEMVVPDALRDVDVRQGPGDTVDLRKTDKIHVPQNDDD